METWKQIESAPHYAVSTLGRIRRIDQPNADRVLNTWEGRRGYTYITLRTNGVSRGYSVHRLVMGAFVGPNTKQVNHKNGVKSDNRLENLEYVSAHANRAHAKAILDAYPKGEKHPNSRLSEDEVRQVFALIDRGMSDRQIADFVGCTGANIWMIRKGKAWKHLAENPRPPNFRGRRVL